MNSHALHQIFQSAMQMMSNITNTLLQVKNKIDESLAFRALQLGNEVDDERNRRKRRRLKVLRWTIGLSFSYASYRFIRWVFRNFLRMKTENMILASDGTKLSLEQMSPYRHANGHRHGDLTHEQFDSFGNGGYLNNVSKYRNDLKYGDPRMYDDYNSPSSSRWRNCGSRNDFDDMDRRWS